MSLNYTEMLDQSAANTGIHAEQALADAGYCSEANLQAAANRKAEHGTDTFMATGRLAHDEQVPDAPRGRIPTNATPRERMARKLRTKPGRAAYSRRKAIVEPVFGQIMTCQDGRELLLRGEDGVPGEWRGSRPRSPHRPSGEDLRVRLGVPRQSSSAAVSILDFGRQGEAPAFGVTGVAQAAQR